MSAQMRITSDVESAQAYAFMLDFMEMVKNPGAIEDAYKKQREQIRLTDDETKAAADARALIAKADAIRKEFDDAGMALSQREKDLADLKETHKDQVSADNQRLNEWENRLTEKQKKQEDIDLAQAAERKKIDDRAKAIEDDHTLWQQNHEADEKDSADVREANRLETERLAKLAEKLKAKADRLVAEAQRDD